MEAANLEVGINAVPALSASCVRAWRHWVHTAANGRSMEEQARTLPREAVGREAEPENLASFIRDCFEPPAAWNANYCFADLI